MLVLLLNHIQDTVRGPDWAPAAHWPPGLSPEQSSQTSLSLSDSPTYLSTLVKPSGRVLNVPVTKHTHRTKHSQEKPVQTGELHA